MTLMPLSLHEEERQTGRTLGQLREILTYIGPVQKVMFVTRHDREISYCMDMLYHFHPCDDVANNVNFGQKWVTYPHLRILFKSLAKEPPWGHSMPVVFDHWAHPRMAEQMPQYHVNRYRDWKLFAERMNRRHDWPLQN